jgi:cysteine-rich repeat protein
MHRKATRFLVSFLVGLSVVVAGCGGEAPPVAAMGDELATRRAAVTGTSKVTLCNLPRYTRQTALRLCGYTSPGSDGAPVVSAWFSVDAGAAIPVVPEPSGGFVDTATALAEGTHAIRLYAQSAAGNLTFEEKTVTVDLTPPTLRVLAPTSADVMTSTVVNVTSSVSDVGPVRVQTQWGATSTVEGGVGAVTQTVDLGNRGDRTLLVRATDAAGNTAEARTTLTFCFSSDAACFASAHWAPVTVSTAQSSPTVPSSGGVTFRVVASDPQSSPLVYAWTASIGTLGVAANGSTTSEMVWTPPACMPPAPPPTVTATVTNALGISVSASFSLTGGAACPPPSVCGDGVRSGGEVCDDANTVTESSCPYGLGSCIACNATCSALLSLGGPYCGDGVANGPEACDDGNTTSEVSCAYGQSNCTACSADCAAVLRLQGAVCGDGVKNGPEACDDGNTTSEVSCPYGQASCTFCNSTCTAALNLAGAVCGDGVKNGPEACDDGNTVTETACPSGQSSCSTCNATCTTALRSLSLLLAGTGAGAISSSPAGINCPSGKCTALFTLGSSVTLTATPAAGSTFSGWSGGGCSGTGSCLVTMTQATSVTASFQAVPVPPAVGVLAGGQNLSLAVRSGTVWSWGSNQSSQLGGTGNSRSSPGQVAGLSGVTALASQWQFSMALHSDGTVSAWGNNSYGQLGTSYALQPISPAKVPSLTSATAVSAGGFHAMALRSDGTLWTWGRKQYGATGDGDTTEYVRTPRPVPNLTGFTAVAAGGYHSLALRSDGTVWAWGYNAYGQLGDGTTLQRNAPIQVPNLTGVIAVAAGHYHSLALRSDGTVWAWGYNLYGQLGEGTTSNALSPMRVSGLTGITALAAGMYHSLALHSDGTLWAWGLNASGQLGDGTRTNRSWPERVSNLTDVTAMVAGSGHSLALRSNGSTWAWGSNSSGALGDGTLTTRLLPVQVLLP